MVRKLIITALLCTGVQSPASSALLIELGYRDFFFGEDTFPMIGVRMLHPNSTLLKTMEMGVSAAFNPLYGGAEKEVYLGVTNLKINHLKNNASFYWGVGGAYIKRSWGDRNGSGGAYYLRVGYAWPKKTNTLHSLELRYLGGPHITVNEYEREAIGHFQLSYQFGWR